MPRRSVRRVLRGLGALILPVRHFRRALHEGADRVRGLLPMVFAAGPANRSDGFLELNLLACEGRIDPDDEEIGAVWAAVDRADRKLAPRQHLA